MRFVKCTASLPGLFESISMEFDECFTVVYGRNGSGKTLISRALTDIVWRYFAPSALLPEKTWDSLYLDMIFQINASHTYRATNKGEKSYGINYVTVDGERALFLLMKEENPGGQINRSIPGILPGGEELRDFLNETTMESMLNSGYLPSPSDFNTGSTFNSNTLHKMLLDDRSGYYGLYKKLKDLGDSSNAIQGIENEITKLRDALREINKKIQIVDIKDSRIDKLNRERDNIKKEIEHLESSLVRFEGQKNILKTIIQDLGKIDNLNSDLGKIKSEVMEEQQKLDSITRLKEEITNLFPQFNDLKIENSLNLEKVQDLFIQIRNINQSIDDAHARRDRKKGRMKKSLWAVNSAGLLASLSLLFFNNFKLGSMLIPLAVILGLSAAITSALGLFFFLKNEKKELDKLNKDKLQFETELKAILEKSRLELQDYRLSELYDFLLQYFEDYMEYTERTQDLINLKSTLKEADYLKAIEEKLDSLKQDEQEIKQEIHNNLKALDIMKDIEPETDKIEGLIGSIDKEIALIEEQLVIKKNIISRIDEEISRNPASPGDLDHFSLMKQKDIHENRLERLRTNQKSIQFIIDLLEEIISDRERVRYDGLITKTLNKFNFLTNNQFVTKIDESVIQKMIAGQPLDSLGPNIIYELHSSLKLSLTDFIADQSYSTPLIIDEPFQFMDDEREKRFRELLMDASKKRQIILFTHHSDKKDWGRYIQL